MSVCRSQPLRAKNSPPLPRSTPIASMFMTVPRYVASLVLVFVASTIFAAEPRGEKTTSDSLQPIASWSFDQQPEGKLIGKVAIEPFGPATPEFPDFQQDNAALSLSAPAYIRLKDGEDEGIRVEGEGR